MKIEIGAPTSYDYSLPLIRYNLSKKYLKNSDVFLDYGCGNGSNTVLFRKKVKKIIGIDVEKNRIEEAKKYIKRNKIENIKYLLYKGEKIPFKKEYFNSIVSFEVIEHTNNDLNSIKEIYRVLDKNGIFILSVPNKYYLMETHGFKLPFNKIIHYNRILFLNLLPDSFYNKYGNARIYTENKITKLLKKSGFKVKECVYIKAPLDKIKNKYIKTVVKNFLKMLPKKMGVSIFLVCQK